MAERINEDLLLEILQWLPVKSLARFRCVSTSWNSLISSSFFITRHLSCSSTRPLMLASHNSQEQPHGEGYLVMDFKDEDDITHIPDFNINTLSYRIVGTVNGVICLRAAEFHGMGLDYYVSFSLWNPMIHKYIELPMSKVLVRYYFWVGFGFKASENDFRVLFIAPNDPGFYPDEYDDSFEADYRVQIFSVREKIWRNLPAEILRHCIVEDDDSQCLFNGILHLIALNNGLKTLLLFDFEKEAFGFMELPESVSDDDIVVTEFKDKLAVVLDYTRPDEIPCCKVWSMREYGDPASWVCIFDVALSTLTRTLGHREERIVGITADGEIVIERENGVFMLHDLDSCTRRQLGLNLEHRINRIYACGFVESLVFMDDESNARCLPS